MKTELEQKIFKDFPVLFENSQLDYIEIGDGWYTIIYEAFAQITSQYDALVVEWANCVNPVRLEELNVLIAKERESLPTITTIKEKFGSLRIYYGNYTERTRLILDKAEDDASVTCTFCGAKGDRTTNRWVEIACDPCRAVRHLKFGA